MNGKIIPASTFRVTLLAPILMNAFLLAGSINNVPTYALPVPTFGPLDHVHNLTVENQSYPIRYGFSDENNARVESMEADLSSKSIIVVIESDDSKAAVENQLFFIELPRNVIDAITTEKAGGCSSSDSSDSTMWVQEHDVPYDIVVNTFSDGSNTTYNGSMGELCDRETRTLSIEYPPGKSTIIIQGTNIIPEFSPSLSALVMAVTVTAVVSVSIAIKRTGQKSHL